MLAALQQGPLRARVRAIIGLLAVSVLVFVWLAEGAGHPVWLLSLIGLFGAILLAFAIALVWFWLRFPLHIKSKTDA